MRARRIVASALAVTLLFTLAEHEAVAAKRAKKKDGWNRKIEAGMNLTEGNKDSVQTRMQLDAKRKSEQSESLLKLRGEIGETSGERTRERVAAEALHRRTLGPRHYMAYRAEFLYDGIADLDYRVLLAPSFGLIALTDAAQELRLELGPAGIVEKKGGEREAYPALLAAEYYECRLTAVSQVKQGVEYIPELRNGSESYLAKAFLELVLEMDEQLSVRLRLESDYDSHPAEGKEKQDTTFSVSLGYTF